MMKLRSGFFLSLVIPFLVLLGCGIETYVYLYPVTQLINSPSSSDTSYNYFQFRTSDKKNYDAYGSDGYFRGFEIFYRIYNSLSTRSSDVSTIYTYNESNPTTSATYLVNSKDYHRLVLTSRETDIPLLPGTSSNRIVSIRLNAESIYSAFFTLDGTLDTTTSIGVPMRTHNSGTSFETFEYTNIDTSDDDVSYTSSSDTTTWYVQAYVAAYGYDESYVTYYSEIFSLGYATIVSP